MLVLGWVDGGFHEFGELEIGFNESGEWLAIGHTMSFEDLFDVLVLRESDRSTRMIS